jgi:hypothetical protein
MSSAYATEPNEAKAEAVNIQKASEDLSTSWKEPYTPLSGFHRGFGQHAILVHELLVVRCVHDVVGKVNEKLCKAALSGRIVPQNRGEGGIAERLGQTLAERLASASVVAQAILIRIVFQR